MVLECTRHRRVTVRVFPVPGLYQYSVSVLACKSRLNTVLNMSSLGNSTLGGYFNVNVDGRVWAFCWTVAFTSLITFVGAIL